HRPHRATAPRPAPPGAGALTTMWSGEEVCCSCGPRPPRAIEPGQIVQRPAQRTALAIQPATQQDPAADTPVRCFHTPTTPPRAAGPGGSAGAPSPSPPSRQGLGNTRSRELRRTLLSLGRDSELRPPAHVAAVRVGVAEQLLDAARPARQAEHRIA